VGKIALLVEDDPGDQEEISKILFDLGFTVVSASDSGEALDCLDGLPFPDLIVLDWFIDGQAAGDGPAQGIIKTILSCSFAPLALVTHDATRAQDNMPKEFPKDFVVFYDKENLRQILQDIETWSKRREFNLPRTVGHASTAAAGRVGWQITLNSTSALDSWLASVDSGHDFLEMFLRLVRRELDKTDQLLKELDNEVVKAQGGKILSSQLLLSALSMDRYFIPAKFEPPMCGDIYHISGGDYAVLVNPACDLVTSPTRSRNALNALLLGASTLSSYAATSKADHDAKNPTQKETRQDQLRRLKSVFKNQDTTGTGLVRVYTLPLVPVGKEDR
jgi:hypothetical protein